MKAIQGNTVRDVGVRPYPMAEQRNDPKQHDAEDKHRF